MLTQSDRALDPAVSTIAAVDGCTDLGRGNAKVEGSSPSLTAGESRRIERLSFISVRGAAMTRDVCGTQALISESSLRALRQALELDDG